MWEDLIDAAAQLLGGVADASGDRSPGPPADVGTLMIIVGVIAVAVGGVAMVAACWPHAVTWTCVGSGIAVTLVGIRLAGR